MHYAITSTEIKPLTNSNCSVDFLVQASDFSPKWNEMKKERPNFHFYNWSEYTWPALEYGLMAKKITFEILLIKVKKCKFTRSALSRRGGDFIPKSCGINVKNLDRKHQFIHDPLDFRAY